MNDLLLLTLHNLNKMPYMKSFFVEIHIYGCGSTAHQTVDEL